MSVTIECCDVQQRVTVTVVRAEPGGTPISDAVQDRVRRRPALRTWDWIVDMREHVPPPPWNVPRLIDLMDSPLVQSHTVIVTGDTAAEAWVRILNSQFRARRHWVASTPAAAAALLDAKSTTDCRLRD